MTASYSIRMQIKTRQHIIDEARTWLGTPFVHQAATKGVGCDCAGLIYHIGQAIGLDVWLPKGYGRYPNKKMLLDCISAQLEEIAIDAVRPGDVLLLRIRREPQHLAIVTDRGMIHSKFELNGRGKIVETTLGERWQKRIIKAFKYPGIED